MGKKLVITRRGMVTAFGIRECSLPFDKYVHYIKGSKLILGQLLMMYDLILLSIKTFKGVSGQ
jgi:hypothetical protein